MMLALRLQRWPNINPTLAQRLLYAGISISPVHGWSTVSDVGPALTKY